MREVGQFVCTGYFQTVDRPMRSLHFPYAFLIRDTPHRPILSRPMRIVLLTLVVFLLAAPAASLASSGAARSGGSLSIVGGRGQVTLRGNGAVLGRMDSGSIQIVDLSPADRWTPAVSVGGKPARSGAVVVTTGDQVTFRLLGGQYRIILRGAGISISAIGKGNAKIVGAPDAAGAGVYAAGDASGGGTPDCLASPTTCTVTRPLEEAARRARRPACHVEDHPRRVRDLGPLQSRRRHAVRPAACRARSTRSRDRSAGATVAVERMTPSLFPIFSFNVTGSLPPADLRDLAEFELRPLLSRVHRRRQRRGAGERGARDLGHRRSRAAERGEADDRPGRRRAQGHQPRDLGRPAAEGLPAVPRAQPPPNSPASTTSGTSSSRSGSRRPSTSATSPRSARASSIAPRSSPATASRPPS